ncbi:MAG: hypothetical protein IOC82_05915 [Aestuariivirga sp.]|uniref:hypothetical protein n=1 Tax=Aestuariivirga sp. TaxID=2650926 RepID=UPI0025C03D14|nr:hypothetical protein [Aestuariivirga sp.]MCA3560552.1 hypothetical protein [Aestuariivirga sp.]
MKTLAASILLSVIFLSAGAFAGANRGTQPAAVSAANPANVTVVMKNGAWPPAGLISVAPCSHTRCLAI